MPHTPGPTRVCQEVCYLGDCNGYLAMTWPEPLSEQDANDIFERIELMMRRLRRNYVNRTAAIAAAEGGEDNG